MLHGGHDRLDITIHRHRTVMTRCFQMISNDNSCIIRMGIHENESCVFFLKQGDPFIESCIVRIIRCGFQMRGREEIHSDNESKQSLRYIDRMSIVSSIFVLKPIIDLLHADVLQYADQLRVLKARVEELEKDNAMLCAAMTKSIKIEPKVPKAEPKVLEKEVVIVEQKPKQKRKPVIGPTVVEIKDDDYAKQAETFEPVNVVVYPSVAPSVQPSTDEKVVVLQDDKTRKDYQKEYQRKYRQQKKEKSK